jgi:hypothetical protein
MESPINKGVANDYGTALFTAAVKTGLTFFPERLF